MLKLSVKNRKVLRSIFSGLGIATISMSIYSCDGLGRRIHNGYGWAAYGMPPDIILDDFQILGRVVSKKTGQGIPGIAIHINEIKYNHYFMTYYNGHFDFYVPKEDSITIIFTDIDGEKNGGEFKQHTITLTREECEAIKETPLLIELEELEENDPEIEE
jgi:hypothetical protein